MAALFFRRKSAPILSAKEQDLIVNHIKKAENITTGEIRIYIEQHCNYVNAMDRAAEIFLELGMEKTHFRNAVLIYLALSDKQYAIFGDDAIFQKTNTIDYFKNTAAAMAIHLKVGNLTQGLIQCIDQCAEQLAKIFPDDPNLKKNELPDEIVFGK